MPNVWQISQHDAPFTVDYSTRSLACDWQMCVLFGREVNLRHHYMISPTLLKPTDKLSLMLICSRIRHASFKIFWCSFVIVRADKTDGEVLWPCPDTGESQYAAMHDRWYLWSRRLVIIMSGLFINQLYTFYCFTVPIIAMLLQGKVWRPFKVSRGLAWHCEWMIARAGNKKSPNFNKMYMW